MSEVIGLDNKLLRSDYVYDSNLGKKQSEINTQAYVCSVYYAGSGDGTFSGEIKFNGIRRNIGNCYSTSTGRFTCPVRGLYIANFGFFSNNNKFDYNNRPTIYVNGGMHIMTSVIPCNLVSVIYCEKGTTISAGCYIGSISFYQASGYNWFDVALLKQL